MKKLSFYFGLLLLVILVLFPGCSKNTKLKKNSITLDSSKKQSATVTELEEQASLLNMDRQQPL